MARRRNRPAASAGAGRDVGSADRREEDDLSTRNRRTALLGLALTIAAIAAAPGVAEKPPRYQFDRGFDFTKLRTFDIRIDESKQREGEMAASVVPRLVMLLEDLLIAKGYTIDTEKPDFVLEWDTMVADDMSSISWSGHGEIAKGMLALRMNEPAQKEPFWIGADFAELTGRITPDKAWKKVDRAARRILAAFPPTP
jgi:hypothetical protein